MRTTFHLKTLAVAIATLSVASVTNAAGLDRSGQDVTAFFQDGTYAEAVYTYIDADVSGYDSANANPSQNAYERGDETGDIAEAYDFFRYGVKADINDTFSVGVLYDEPFGAAAEYTQSNFVSQGDVDASIASITNGLVPSLAAAEGAIDSLAPFDGSLPEEQQATLDRLRGAVAVAQAEAGTAGENTNVEVRSQSLTGILGMKFGADKNFQVYGGPVAQRIQSETKLRGLAYGPASGYTSNSNPDMDYGYIAGIAYSKPEIALKAALTYRSEIDHNIEVSETYPLVGLRAAAAGATPEQAAAAANRNSKYEITTPKSVNFDFQTGINPTTLATAKVRWVPWSDFVITPPLYNDVSKISYGPDGLNLVEYEDDQWQVELGLAKRVAPALAISGTVGWDSGAGNPVTSLGPIEGYYSVGLGAKYNVTENWAVSAGGKYLWFGDAKGQLPSDKLVGDFQDNDGYIAGVKISYQAK
ncbi:MULTISPECIES: outer membrane protein transport protein [unclassified Psychrobacter]|uniref:outer membrane protein transport protein n=1 Tax=unclassified Psychrobacter TaxID=196806 RepID=UPI0025B4C016|nr:MULTISPECIES: outer membrane protein transport protein [unclassified Psychrobacter]MDN3452481.1 outer membrane protein transport protein [Psychrobacter sp. APC 3350]MDN3502195.1 outer membrane protein transport protein [Psychrobacter sp. 5A.1]